MTARALSVGLLCMQTDREREEGGCLRALTEEREKERRRGAREAREERPDCGREGYTSGDGTSLVEEKRKERKSAQQAERRERGENRGKERNEFLSFKRSFASVRSLFLEKFCSKEKQEREGTGTV